LDQAKAPEWHAAMVAANIDILAMSYEESVLSFKCLENLEKVRRTNGPSPTLHIDDKKSITSSLGVGKFNKSSKQWCHLCDKNNHSTAYCRAIAKPSSKKRLPLEPRQFPERSLWLFFLRKQCNQEAIKASKDCKFQEEES
jgi:hypothetical protein